MTTAVIIVAAGSGTRLGSALPKAFVSVAGVPMLQRSLDVVSAWTRCDSIVLVVPRGYEAPATALGLDSRVRVALGGDTRGDSVQAGLAALPEGTSHVLIHDAARALMPLEVFDRVLDSLESGASGVIPQIPVVDTLVKVDTSTRVTEDSVHREELGVVQTPQGFRVDELLKAYAGVSTEYTDDAAVLRQAGHTVVEVAGHTSGFKITYPEDLERAEALLGSAQAPLVGMAMDVHQFDASQPLKLAGLLWPGEPGLSGHSDGDAVIHAIVDAMLQAARLGDLGTHFGVDRDEFEGADSAVFLTHTLALLAQSGLSVSSVGVQVVAATPKIGPRRLEAEEKLSTLVGAPVSLSATTTDGLGFTGRGEGVLALATAVLKRS
ncbi:MAG: hypothetical protein RL187_471 [Actinomycetota bacterium]